jgi:hypothetical protein
MNVFARILEEYSGKLKQFERVQEQNDSNPKLVSMQSELD